MEQPQGLKEYVNWWARLHLASSKILHFCGVLTIHPLSKQQLELRL